MNVAANVLVDGFVASAVASFVAKALPFGPHCLCTSVVFAQAAPCRTSSLCFVFGD